MISVWQTHNNGSLRFFHNDAWLTADTWQQLTQKFLQNDIQDKHVCLYAPSAAFVQSVQEVPKSQLKSLGSNGIRYLLEDEILGDVESLQLKYVHDNENELSIIAIEETVKQGYEQAAQLVGLEIVALVPDFYLLPESSELASICVYSEDTLHLVRYAQHSGVTTSSLEHVMPRLPHLDKARHIEVLGHVSETNAELINSLDTADDCSFSQEQFVTLQPLTDPTRHTFNFIPKKAGIKLSAYANTVITVLMATTLVVGAYNVISIKNSQKSIAITEQQIRQQYQEWFPAQRVPSDVITYIKRNVAKGSGQQGSVFASFNSVSQVLQQNKVFAKKLSVSKNTISIDAHAPQLTAIEQAVAQINEQGMKAQLQNSRTNETGVMANIVVTP